MRGSENSSPCRLRDRGDSIAAVAVTPREKMPPDLAVTRVLGTLGPRTSPPLRDDGLDAPDGLVGGLVRAPLVHVGARHRLAPHVLRVDLRVRGVLVVLEHPGGALEVDAGHGGEMRVHRPALA